MAVDLTPEKLARIVRWAVIAVVVYAIWHTLSSPPKPASRPGAGKQTAQAIDCGKQSSPFENFSMITAPLFASFSPAVHVEDIVAGTGEPARCGQHAQLRYSYATPNGTVIFTNKDGNAPAENILIGGNTMLPGFEQGLIGMKPGGERAMLIPPNKAFGAVKDFHALRDSTKFKLPKTVGSITAKAWLGALTPSVPSATMEARVIDNQFGSGVPVLCGEKVLADIAVYKLDGTRIFSTADGKPIAFTPGLSQVPYGIEQAVIGMNEGGRRTLILPPGYGNPLDPRDAHSALPAEFTLPEQEIVLVEIGVRTGVKEPSPEKKVPENIEKK